MWLVVAVFLVLEPFVLTVPGWSGHNVPVNLQQGNCFPFCSFLSLCEWKSVNTFKVQASVAEHWERAVTYISGYRQYSFTKVQSQTKHRQWSTKVNVLEKNVCSTFFFYFFYFFIFGCVGSSVRARAFSSCGKQGPLFVAVRGLLFIAVHGPFTIAAPPVAGHRLQTCRLSSCGSRAQLLRGMWDPPRPGLEPVSPALAGRFSTTAPPGKPGITIF